MMNPFIIGGAIVGILLLTYLLIRTKSPPAATPAGGTAVAGSPAATTPIPSGGTTASVAVASPELPKQKLVKRIRITKNTTSKTSGVGDWRTFQVAEVYAYTSERKLSAADFSEAVLSSPYGDGSAYPASNVIDGNMNTFAHSGNDLIGVLTLTLKNELPLTRVEVLNRQDCCQDRLSGAQITFEDVKGNVIWNDTLIGARDVQLFTIPNA